MEDDKHLSGEEKRRRMKEQFKQELRERKEFLEKVKRLRHSQRITKALEEMNVEDDSQDWIDRLNQETAFNEAKMEMALESVENTDDEELAADEEVVKESVAEEMVRKMKEQIAAEQEAGLSNSNSGAGELNTELPEEEGKEEGGDDEEDPPFRKMMSDLK